MKKISNPHILDAFTPSIKFDRKDDYLINPKDLDSPYMTIVSDSTPIARNHLVAAIHPYDKTVRPQLINRQDNPSYYDLINEFDNITGIGALLNSII